MFSLKNIIFGLFGVEAKLNDTYKDQNGKGIWERYNESVAEYYDESVDPLIVNIFENVLLPNTMFVRFLDIQIEALGNLPVISDDPAIKRKVIQYFNILGTIKGTLKSFEMLFSFIGITVDDVIDVDSGFTFDDDNATFDDPVRTFDSGNPCCGTYELNLSGNDPIDDDLENSINIINNYLKPINSEASVIRYNGQPITIV